MADVREGGLAAVDEWTRAAVAGAPTRDLARGFLLGLSIRLLRELVARHGIDVRPVVWRAEYVDHLMGAYRREEEVEHGD